MSGRLLVLLVTLGTAAAVDMEIGNHWSGGFQAKACLPVTTDHHGWHVRVTFSSPLTSLDAYTADIAETLDGGKTYVLTNKAWNADEHVGDTLCLEMQGHAPGDTPPTGTAILVGEESVTGGPATPRPTVPTVHVTPAHTTATPAHTTAPPVRTTQPPAQTTARLATLGAGAYTPWRLTLDTAKHWSGGFDAYPCFTPSEDVDNWSALVDFNMPVTGFEVYIAVINQTLNGGRTYLLVNKEWNPHFDQGHTFCIQMHGRAAGDVIPTGTIEIVGKAGPTTTPVPITAGPTVSGGFTRLTVTNYTGNIFTGDFFIPVTKDMDGWKLNITFSEPVTHLDMPMATPFSRSADYKHWVLVGNADRSNLKSGTIMDFHFTGTHQGTDVPEGSAGLQDLFSIETR